MVATEKFRSFLRTIEVYPEENDVGASIYLSRRNLPHQKGRFFGEDRLWELLEQNGYREIHLQDMSLRRQMETIHGASRIVSPDGSPMHTVSYFANPDAKVAMIHRRRSDEVANIAKQFRNLQQRDLVEVDAVLEVWNTAGSTKVNNTVLAEIDLATVADKLRQHDLIKADCITNNLLPDEIASEIRRFQRPPMEKL